MELGRSIDEVGPETHVIVFSGHGMAPQFHGRDPIPALLDLWGLSGRSGGRSPADGGEIRVEVRGHLVHHLKASIPIAAPVSRQATPAQETRASRHLPGHGLEGARPPGPRAAGPERRSQSRISRQSEGSRRRRRRLAGRSTNRRSHSSRRGSGNSSTPPREIAPSDRSAARTRRTKGRIARSCRTSVPCGRARRGSTQCTHPATDRSRAPIEIFAPVVTTRRG